MFSIRQYLLIITLSSCSFVSLDAMQEKSLFQRPKETRRERVRRRRRRQKTSQTGRMHAYGETTPEPTPETTPETTPVGQQETQFARQKKQVRVLTHCRSRSCVQCQGLKKHLDNWLHCLTIWLNAFDRLDKACIQCWVEAHKGPFIAFLNACCAHNANIINCCDKERRNTLLHLTTARGLESFVDALLERGAWLHVSNIYGNLPVHIAAIRGFQSIGQKLVKKYPESFNAKNKYGFTPEWLARAHGNQAFLNREIIARHGDEYDWHEFVEFNLVYADDYPGLRIYCCI